MGLNEYDAAALRRRLDETLSVVKNFVDYVGPKFRRVHEDVVRFEKKADQLNSVMNDLVTELKRYNDIEEAKLLRQGEIGLSISQENAADIAFGKKPVAIKEINKELVKQPKAHTQRFSTRSFSSE